MLVGPFDAVAVTPGLREWYATSQDEDLEYAAMARAADLALDAAVDGRRVVVAVEVDAAVVRVVDDPVGAVVLDALAADAVASFHIDAADAVTAVRAAREAMASARTGEVPDAVEDLDDHELAWFAAQELDDVLGVLGAEQPER